jgi:hypothetical protein
LESIPALLKSLKTRVQDSEVGLKRTTVTKPYID